MGKIRIKTLGDEDLEKKQKQEARKKKEVKKQLSSHPRENGGPDAVALDAKDVDSRLRGNDKEEVKEEAKIDETSKTTEKVAKAENQKEEKKARKEKFATSKKQTRSKKYQTVAKLLDKNRVYSLPDALEILPKLKIAKFDETVELHINTTESGISGNLSLPHGTGKKTRVAIVTDALIVELEKSLPATPSQAARAPGLRGGRGKIDFDVLLATPQMMPHLAKVARILGPKGLMPNPKNGTISPNPEVLIKKYEQGQISFKTEAKTPIIHLSVGKLSFGDKKLFENIKAVLSAIQSDKVIKVVLKSTMSPGIKIDSTSINSK